MLDREEILDEIRRCAAENGGKPLGREAFVRDTGVKKWWIETHWLRWSDAVAEAGLRPNTMTIAFSDDRLLTALALLTREIGHFPLSIELRHMAGRTPDFPGHQTFQRLGEKRERIRRLAEFCAQRPEYADVAALLGHASSSADESAVPQRTSTALTGYVYLAKSGRHYKIGQTNDLVRRTNELRIQLPEKMQLVHQIATDDPIGIEQYWHHRFDHLRANGEWFALTASDVAIFKRRRFM